MITHLLDETSDLKDELSAISVMTAVLLDETSDLFHLTMQLK